VSLGARPIALSGLALVSDVGGSFCTALDLGSTAGSSALLLVIDNHITFSASSNCSGRRVVYVQSGVQNGVLADNRIWDEGDANSAGTGVLLGAVTLGDGSIRRAGAVVLRNDIRATDTGVSVGGARGTFLANTISRALIGVHVRSLGSAVAEAFFANNVISGTLAGALVTETSSGTFVHNVIRGGILGSEVSGVVLGTNTGSPTAVLVNNFIDGGDTTGTAGQRAAAVRVTTTTASLTLRNNNLYGPDQDCVLEHRTTSGTTTCLTSASLTTVNGCTWAGCTQAGLNIHALPRFVSPATGDYRLETTSTSIDAAIAPTPWDPRGFTVLDRARVRRPLGPQPDIGAYEMR
jgi:hypothetical protein